MIRATLRLITTMTFTAAMTVATTVYGYDSAYEKTPENVIEIRELPAGRWIATEMEGAYFEHSNDLFQRLFEYIKANEISMTVPVQGGLTHAEMRFYLDEDVSSTATETDVVRIVDEPARWVASIGAQGAYTDTNVNEARRKLTQWLDGQTGWRASGEPYAVFWNGPFTLWFMKRFEVHVPIEPVTAVN